jgi:hypothetical protein
MVRHSAQRADLARRRRPGRNDEPPAQGRSGGFKPTTAREAIKETETRDDLRDALMTVAGRGGKIDGRALGNWLGHHAADRVVNLSDDLAPQPVAVAACGVRQGVALWA